MNEVQVMITAETLEKILDTSVSEASVLDLVMALRSLGDSRDDEKTERLTEEIERLKPPALGTGKWDPTDDAADNPDYIGASYHADAAATPYPGVTPSPTSHRTKTWKYRW